MELDLGPLNVLISWQTLLLALGVATATHGVKRVLDFTVGGTEQRRKKLLVNRVILPGVPIFLGCLFSLLVPLHPDALMDYINEHSYTGMKQYSILGVFGMCVGQFSDYVWHRYSSLKDGVKEKRREKTEPAETTEPPKEG